MDVLFRRGPGRPRKVLTGRPGRPAKQYNMVPIVAESQELEIEDGSSDDGSLIWEDAELALNACEIQFDKAVSGPDRNEWLDAIYSEVRSLIANDTFSIEPRPESGRVIKCRTVLRNKFDADGNLIRRKARVVAKGYAQVNVRGWISSRPTLPSHVLVLSDY